MKVIGAKKLFKRDWRGWGTVFAFALLFHFGFCLVGWNHSLLEHHGYRQCQTAVAVEYMIRDGAWINYITPVLGPPWQVPLEFPLYQIIVAGICLLIKTPIDQTGRAVSLFFFYASLWPMNLFLRYLIPEKNLRFMVLSLVLFAPVYIYFSRVVMIESTSLFFGFCFLVLAVRQFFQPNVSGFAAMLVLGILCALVKITTFCAFCFPCLIVPLVHGRNSGQTEFPTISFFRTVQILLPGFLIPVLAGVWWTHRSDLIKMASPATADLTSSGMSSWNFGFLAQRLDPTAWFDVLVKMSFGLTFYPLLIVIFAFAFFVKGKDARLFLLLLAPVVPPILVFFNLYLAHEYYFYACSVFVIFALGYVCACLLRKRSKWGKLLWFGTAVSFMLMYATFLLPKQLQEDSPLKAVVKIVRENSGEDDLLLIYGDVWSSAIPYSSRRKAFMNYHFVREDIQKFDAKMEKVEGWEKIRMAVVNENTVPMFPYLRDRLISLGFAEKPDFVVGGFSIYKKHPK